MKSLNEEKKIKESKEINPRRKFMKKAVYAAPTLLVMGSLLNPTETSAALGNVHPPSSPNNWP